MNFIFNNPIKILIGLLFVVILFHLSIIIKIIPYGITWGGRLTNDTEMYIFETISILINVFLSWVLLMKGNFVKHKFPNLVVKTILWIFFALFILNTIGNIFAKTIFEKQFAFLTGLFSILLWGIVKQKKTTNLVVDWADVFTRNVYKDILIESWKHCQQHKGLLIHAYVIMTNHVHMIISKNSIHPLEDIMRDMKKFTASKIIDAIKSNKQESRREWLLSLFVKAGEENSNNKIFQFWRQDNHPVLCDTPEMLKQKINYTHENPVRAGFVEKPEDWVYSSAGDYILNRKGLVEVCYV